MTDEFEESLREALASAVPTPPDERGRAAGARGYARRVRRTRAVLAVGAAVAVAAAIAVIPSVFASPTQHIADTVHKGPAPASRVSGRLLAVGGPEPGSLRPLSGHVTLQGRQITDLQAGADGRFGGSLPPGRYRVVGHSPSYGGGRYTCQPVHPFITVRTGQTIHVSVLCQEK